VKLHSDKKYTVDRELVGKYGKVGKIIEEGNSYFFLSEGSEGYLQIKIDPDDLGKFRVLESINS
jgi:hypothetical protein